MPNPIAYLALLIWPAIAAGFFNAYRKAALERVIIWLVVWSYMFLPQRVVIDLPAIPPMDKITIPNLVLLILVATLPGVRLKLLPRNSFGALCLIMLFLSALPTALTNGDPLQFGPTFLQGTSLYDALSDMIRDFLKLVPFIIGYSLLGTARAQREFLHALVIAGLVYSIPIIFENRISPQLHKWIYGFHQHSFEQHVRGGNFRPMVFMEHGLYVAFFSMTTAVSAAILWNDVKARLAAGLIDPDLGHFRPPTFYRNMIAYLFAVLILCWSMGSLIFGALLLPLVLFVGCRTQVWIAAIMVSIAVSYPALRGAGWIPIDWLVEQAYAVNPDRGQSLAYRIQNEEAMLAHASERPWFGWGGWGRNRVYDLETGDELTIPDGFWVIIIGTQGWLGYIAVFGLLALPVWMTLGRMWRQRAPPVDPMTAGLCLLLGINMIELLPNSTFPPWTWLLAGMLLACAENPTQAKDQIHAKTPSASVRRRTVL